MAALSPNPMQKAVERGLAPDGVERVDRGNPDLFEQPHVHFQGGAALNKDGTWKHGNAALTSDQRKCSKTTTGYYPDKLITDRVVDWIGDVFQTRRPIYTEPYTIHLDALLHTAIEHRHAVSVSFRALEILIEQISPRGIPDEFMPALRIPLTMADTLEAPPPSAEVLVEQIDEHEPPSLYLVRRSDLRRPWPVEQYTMPIQSGLFTSQPGVYVYYNTLRSLEDIRNGWEYGRNIAADYYPVRPHSFTGAPAHGEQVEVTTAESRI